MAAQAGESVEEGGHSSITGGVQTCATHMEINVAVPHKIGNQSFSISSYMILGHIPKG